MPKRDWRFALPLAFLAVLAAAPARAQDSSTQPSTPPIKSNQVNVNWLYGAYVPKDVPLTPLTGRGRAKLFVAQSFTTPGIYIKTVVFSVSDQIKTNPPEWGSGISGYGRRVASRYGQSLIQNSLSSTGDALLRYEPRYDRCRCSGFWPRTGHAFLRNFVTYNHTEKDLRPRFALYAAALGSGAISSTWYPGEQSAWVKGYQAMITQAGWGLFTNWLGEFAPEISRKLRRKK